MKSNLLVIYEVIPDNIFCFIVESDNPDYDKWEKSHGLIINSYNEEDYDEEIRKFICDFDFSNYKLQIFNAECFSESKEINGKYKIIFTGFRLE